LPDNPSGQLFAASGIGQLRWVVSLWQRQQAPDTETAIVETFVKIADVHADVQPTYASTFYQSTQVDTPVTHLITMRWQDYPSTIDVVTRVKNRPDMTLRGELYRVRRTKEVGGRLRFLQIESELERSRTLPDDTDATINAFLTEPYDGAAAAPPGDVSVE
jgi:head-tail adaptor